MALRREKAEWLQAAGAVTVMVLGGGAAWVTVVVTMVVAAAVDWAASRSFSMRWSWAAGLL
jgi:hypothetical protein